MSETEYIPDGEYIPIKDWGKDHYSTLAYLETRAVDGGGKIENPRMRCHSRLHRAFMHTAEGRTYPTRLKNGERDQHDDWSCLEDMAAAGLLKAFFATRYGEPFGGGRARVEFTDAGLALAHKLRAWKANGGSFGTFDPFGPTKPGAPSKGIVAMYEWLAERAAARWPDWVSVW